MTEVGQLTPVTACNPTSSNTPRESSLAICRRAFRSYNPTEDETDYVIFRLNEPNRLRQARLSSDLAAERVENQARQICISHISPE